MLYLIQSGTKTFIEYILCARVEDLEVYQKQSLSLRSSQSRGAERRKHAGVMMTQKVEKKRRKVEESI